MIVKFIQDLNILGTSKLNLCLPDCTWVDSYEEDLYLIDAGTDDGVSFNASHHIIIEFIIYNKI